MPLAHPVSLYNPGDLHDSVLLIPLYKAGKNIQFSSETSFNKRSKDNYEPVLTQDRAAVPKEHVTEYFDCSRHKRH